MNIFHSVNILFFTSQFGFFHCAVIYCEFLINIESTYTCGMRKFYNSPIETTLVIGNNIQVENSSLIIAFEVITSPTKYYPTKICHYLEHLEEFRLFSPKAAEIKRNIFEECLKVKIILIGNAKIEILDENLFLDVPLLEEILIYNTELEILQKNIFKENPELKRVFLIRNKLKIIEVEFSEHLAVLSMRENTCIDDQYAAGSVKSTPLEELIKNIKENCV